MLDQFFADIFILNLPHRKDRREEMEVQLRNAEVTSAQFFDAFLFPNPGIFHRAGSRGCYLSILTILKKCINARNVCILQDDLNFARDFKMRHAIFGSLPTNWGIFYGGYHSRPIVKFPRELNLLDPNQEFVGAHFFAVNGPVIGKLVETLETFLTRPRDHPDGGPMPIDGALNKFRQLNPDLPAYTAYPLLGYQRSSRSDCETSKWFDRTPVVSAAVASFRQIKNSLTP